LLLVLAGSVSLHLAANSVDDVFDYLNGVDKVSEKAFPKDFPGWKPIPRGLISVKQGALVASGFYGLSLLIAGYLSLMVGYPAFVMALLGVVLSYFYTAPPLKLDYRGLGLGELAIFVSFGPLPALGAYYVFAQNLVLLPVLASIPQALLTVAVLINHDMIFYDSYKSAGKKTLTVRLGRGKASYLSTAIAAAAYLIATALIAVGYLPPLCLLIFAAFPLFFSLIANTGKELTPPEYGARTARAFMHSIAFGLLMVLGLIL
jgi:1,4-dihydroxy-2-naphthoate octaprenyltransferase